MYRAPPKDSIALKIVQMIHRHNPSAYTLEGGYMVNPTVRFPVGRDSEERRNANGRCTHSITSYPDGSKIRYRWHPSHGAKLDVIDPPRELER